MSIRASILGAVTGFFPIGWIVLNVIFLYRLTLEKGAFETLQTTIGGLTNDRRLQLLLIAFSFGAFSPWRSPPRLFWLARRGVAGFAKELLRRALGQPFAPWRLAGRSCAPSQDLSWARLRWP
jgi:hypothetical protein